jgi:hypothetical protein
VGEFRIAKEFTHRGVIYSPGEPPPGTLRGAEMEERRREGCIAVWGEPSVPAAAPSTSGQSLGEVVKQTLRGHDGRVLRALRQRADPDLTRAVLEMAVRQRRVGHLIEALRFALGIPISEEEAQGRGAAARLPHA